VIERRPSNEGGRATRFPLERVRFRRFRHESRLLEVSPRISAVFDSKGLTYGNLLVVHQDHRVRQAVAAYLAIHGDYVQFTDSVRELLARMLVREDIGGYVEARTKDVDSFERKISLKGYRNPLQEVTDLAALRVLTRTLTEVDRAVAWIRHEFDVDEDRSSDKSEALGLDQFGYVSKHLIVRPQNRLSDPGWSKFVNFVAEIQLRTFIQHSWATVYRRLGYKHERDIPPALHRRLYRLSASLESADAEIDAVWHETARVPRAAAGEIPAERQGLGYVEYVTFINENAALDRLCQFLTSVGYDCAPAGLLADDLDVLNALGARGVADLEQVFMLTTPWSRTFLAEDYQSQISRSRRAALIKRNDVFMRLFVASHPEMFLRGDYQKSAERALRFSRQRAE
jgi:ppGpp synthetase/RelA/SpoT-type nucleotidyltranferase